ncbi:hypothetical protein [Bradyrhizobium sp. CCBAU 51745]|uniref:hypothetical protein n=1 Tax=Bradyrhizobium sp. CCBAU 51745 TaxID=1325099 RepID=UPI002306D111|nr:hypothetical protein [Bradyrhizobium sp. CCBAU 51745]
MRPKSRWKTSALRRDVNGRSRGRVILRGAGRGGRSSCGEAVGSFERCHRSRFNYLKTLSDLARQLVRSRYFSIEPSTNLSNWSSRAPWRCIGSQQGCDEARSIDLGGKSPNRPVSEKRLATSPIQLRGGIGMTMEYSVGHYFKRVTMIDTLFGNADHHL